MREIITMRDIEMVTSDIKYAQRQGARQLLSNLIEIGRLLVEAKSMVAHGEWGKYLEEQVDYSQSTANNLMKLYQEYGDNQESFFGSMQNSQAFGKLSYTQALALLALPREEREAFAEEHDPEETSSRDWEKAVREKEAELREAQQKQEAAQEDALRAADALKVKEDEANKLRESVKAAETAKSNADAKVEKLQAQLKKARENEKDAKDALVKAKEHPEIPESMMEEMRRQVAADAAKQATEDLQKQLAAALRQAEDSAAQVKAAEEKLKAAQKAVQMANPDVAVFRSLYIQLQETWNRTVGAYQKARVADEGAAAGCLRALNAAIEKFRSDIAAEGQADV